MGKRKPKHRGVFKTELQNEPIKFQVNPQEHAILKRQVENSKFNQSEYLRYLLLEAPHRTLKDAAECSYINPITILGRQLNAIAKNINQALLRQEAIAIPTGETVFSDLEEVLKNLDKYILEIKAQETLVRDEQVKFLVTPTQLATAKNKIKVKKITLSRYLRQQITGYREVKHKTKAEQVAGAIGRLGNNINQIAGAISLENRSSRLTIIDQETKFQIQFLQQEIQSLQQRLLEEGL